MKRTKIIFLFIGIFLLKINICDEVFCQQKEQRLIRIQSEEKNDISKLDDLDLDFAYRGLKKYVDVVVDDNQLQIIKSRGFQIEFLPQIEKKNLYDPEYHTYEEMAAELQTLAATYPDITEVYQIGVSQQYQIPILAIKISDNADVDEDEFTVNFDGMHHAREPMGLETCMVLINYLLKNYGVDPQVTEIVDNVEIWITPILNTEGYKYLVDNDLSSPWWRKNQRDNNNNGQFDPNFDGVDLNRNYDYKFLQGGETDFSSWNYRGPYPFSESETSAKRNLALKEHFLCSITYHSYAQEIYYYRGVNGRTLPETPIIDEIADSIAGRIPKYLEAGNYRPGGTTTSTNMSYPWMFAVTGAYEYLIELGTEHLPPGSVAQQIANENLNGAMYLLEKTVAGPGIKGNVFDAATGNPVVANIRIKEYFSSDLEPRMSEATFGRFNRFASPGIYTLEIIATGYTPKIINNVAVNYTGWTDVQIPLELGGTPVLQSYSLDDDSLGASLGNGDGFASINETVEISIDLKNTGLVNLNNISGQLISKSNLVKVVDGIKEFKDITVDSVSSSIGKYSIKIDPRNEDGSELPFLFRIAQNNNFYWEEKFTIPVNAPVLNYQYLVVHDSLGNNNGALEPGETADLEIVIANNGHLDASMVRSVLSIYNSYFESITKMDTSSIIEVGKNSSMFFTVKLSANTPDPYLAELKITLLSQEKYSTRHIFLLPCVAGFFDNMEFGENGWWSEVRGNPVNNHNDWQLGSPVGGAGGQDPSSAYSGRFCWGNDLGGEGWNGYYQHNVNIYLNSPVINCSNYQNVGLKYQRWLNVRNGDLAEILINNQPVWSNHRNGVYDSDWKEHFVDIKTIADGNDSVVVSFHLSSDDESWAGGWNIDDVLVKNQLTSAALLLAEKNLPFSYNLFQNYPNPFNSETTLKYQLPETGRVKITVFNLMGQKIAQLGNHLQKPGNYSIVWNGKDLNKKDVASGIYFIQFKVTNKNNVIKYLQLQKIMLVR